MFPANNKTANTKVPWAVSIMEKYTTQGKVEGKSCITRGVP